MNTLANAALVGALAFAGGIYASPSEARDKVSPLGPRASGSLDSQPGERFRVATYNLLNAPSGRRERIEAAATLLAPSRLDWVGLQEAATAPLSTWHPIRWLAERLGLRAFDTYQENFIVFRSGLSLLSRWGWERAEFHAFRRHRFYDPKGWVHAEVRTPAGLISVVDTHLTSVGASEDDRALQASQLEDLGGFLAGLPADRPRIVLGDFNAEPESTALRGFAERGRLHSMLGAFADLRNARTWATEANGACSGGGGLLIDYVFASQDFKFVSAEVPRATAAPFPSDHCPVVAELELKAR